MPPALSGLEPNGLQNRTACHRTAATWRPHSLLEINWRLRPDSNWRLPARQAGTLAAELRRRIYFKTYCNSAKSWCSLGDSNPYSPVESRMSYPLDEASKFFSCRTLTLMLQTNKKASEPLGLAGGLLGGNCLSAHRSVGSASNWRRTASTGYERSSCSSSRSSRACKAIREFLDVMAATVVEVFTMRVIFKN